MRQGRAFAFLTWFSVVSSIFNCRDDTYHLNALLTALHQFAFKNPRSKGPESTDELSRQASIACQYPDVIFETKVRLNGICCLNFLIPRPRRFSQKQKQRRIAHSTAVNKTHATTTPHLKIPTTMQFAFNPLMIQQPQQNLRKKVASRSSCQPRYRRIAQFDRFHHSWKMLHI